MKDEKLYQKFAKIIDQALDDDCEQLYYQEATDLINDLLKLMNNNPKFNIKAPQ